MTAGSKAPPKRTQLRFKRRALLAGAVALGLLGVGYRVWAPGTTVRDGRHDRRANGIWLQHGWLGDDGWFARYHKQPELFRDRGRIEALAALLAAHGMRYILPHACPTSPSGEIAPVDAVQTERFLDGFDGFVVLPWIGGVLDVQAFPESGLWRHNFVTSIRELLHAHPRLGGVHVNIEPMPAGNEAWLSLLDELRSEMPPEKLISVAAYPPPTAWQPFSSVHWDEAYYRQVAARVDQLVPMMYDTGLHLEKPYRHLMTTWTKEILAWSESTQVLLGLPAYDDAGVGYHSPDVENLGNALAGVHQALKESGSLPRNYGGVAIYCEWEMDADEWSQLRHEFEHQADL